MADFPLIEPLLPTLAVILLLAYVTQTIAGFGSTIVALTLGSQLQPLVVLLPILIALDIPVSGYLFLRYRHATNRELLTRTILPWMTAGVLIGVAVSSKLEGPMLKRCFGALVLFFAAKEMWALTRKSASDETRAMPNALMRTLVVLSGFVHGIYATGGPILVSALSQKKLDRDSFRGTLTVVWLIFDVLLILEQLRRGQWTTSMAIELACLVPLFPLGVFIGEKLQQHIPERGYRIFIQVLLAVAGTRLLMA